MSALALQFDYVRLPTPASAFVDLLSGLVDFRRNVKSVVKESMEKMDKAEQQLQTSIAALQQSIATAERAAAAGLLGRVDKILEDAENAELQMRREHEQLAKTFDHLGQLLRKKVPIFGREVIPVIERFHRVGEWYIGELQDARWRLMAIRADENRNEHGPVFANSRDLARHLRSITG